MKAKVKGLPPTTDFLYKDITLKFKDGVCETNVPEEKEVLKKFDGKYWKIEKAKKNDGKGNSKKSKGDVS